MELLKGNHTASIIFSDTGLTKAQLSRLAKGNIIMLQVQIRYVAAFEF
jgi:hypothetical protein